jgi:hypothetical protein
VKAEKLWVVLRDGPDEQDVFVALYPTEKLAEERVTEEEAHDPYPWHFKSGAAEIETKVKHRKVKKRRPLRGGPTDANVRIVGLTDAVLAGDE